MLIIAIAFFVGARFVISDPRESGPVHFVIPLTEDIPLFSCPFYSMTALPCPVCGITRSSALMVRGDFTGSFGAHPLGPILVIGMTLAIPLSIWKLFTTASEDAGRSGGRRWLLWVVVALITVSWGVSLGRHFGLINW